MNLSKDNYRPENKNDLQELMGNPEQLKELLEGSDFLSNHDTALENFKAWERARKYIAQAIDHDGSLLDYGCANGFLLKCLQEWSPYTINPYGVDIDETRLEQARELFETKSEHFLNTQEKTREEAEVWLNNKSFDYIHWNVWDNTMEEYVQQNNDEESLYVESLIQLFQTKLNEGGKIILSTYHTGAMNVGFITKLQKKFKGEILKNETGDDVSFIITKPLQ